MECECPHCGKELELNSPADYNGTYGNTTVIAKALCCGKGVTLTPVRGVKIRKYEGTDKVDGWGEELK